MADPIYTPDSTGSNNVLLAALRRWWLLVIGLLLGSVLAFFGYATRPPTYQSIAKIRVLKRDSTRSVNDNGRFGYVDDYVATQLETIQSEYILSSAAQSAKMREASAGLNEKLKAEKPSAFEVLKTSLTVSRSKENTIGLTGNSILNLAYVGGDARDTQVVLDAIIETFTRDLTTKSDDTIKQREKNLASEILAMTTAVDEEKKKRTNKLNERYGITSEEPATINVRWTSSTDDLFKINQQLAEIDTALDAIKLAGNNRTERSKIFKILSGGQRFGADTSGSSLEGNKIQLEMQRKQYAETLGKDSAPIKEIDAKLEYLGKEIARLNPDNPNGDIDELKIHELTQMQRKASLEKQAKALENRATVDYKHIMAIRPLLIDIEEYERRIGNFERQIADKSSEKARLSAAITATATEGGFEATVLNKPREGTKVGPILATWLVPGAVLGLLLGAGLALLVELGDKGFRSPAEIRSRLGVPVIGHLAKIRTDLPREADISAEYDPSLVCALRPKSPEAEAFRGVRAQILSMVEANKHQLLQVTSPSPGDGKSTLAANLAISLAQSGKRTILVDCDFRKPRVYKLFALPRADVGLASVTAGSTDLPDAIRGCDIANLDLLPCGPRPENPAELLSGVRFREILKELKDSYDFVIVDTPPLLAVSDPRVVAQRVDGVVLTFRITKNVRPKAQRAVELLTDMGANLIGTCVNSTSAGTSDYAYGYGYGSDYKYNYEYNYSYGENEESN